MGINKQQQVANTYAGGKELVPCWCLGLGFHVQFPTFFSIEWNLSQDNHCSGSTMFLIRLFAGQF